jgi:hypothetical protein
MYVKNSKMLLNIVAVICKHITVRIGTCSPPYCHDDYTNNEMNECFSTHSRNEKLIQNFGRKIEEEIKFLGHNLKREDGMRIYFSELVTLG